jgi:hypothetical protein
VVIRGHVSGGFYLAEAVDRHHYYPETLWPEGTYGYWSPTMWVDGRDERTSADGDVIRQWGVYKNMVSTRLGIPTPLVMDLSVQYGDRGDTARAVVQVIAEDSVAFNDLHLRLAVIESGLNYKGSYNQVLRDYFPGIGGIYFTIARGDTFVLEQDFIWDEVWLPSGGRVAAFVQDDENRDVLQAVQAPLLAPVPEQPEDLTVTLSGDDLRLDWSPVSADTAGSPLMVDHYHVYRDTVPVSGTGFGPLAVIEETFFLDEHAAAGDAGENHFYFITAVAGAKESAASAGAGEFDRGLTAGK